MADLPPPDKRPRRPQDSLARGLSSASLPGMSLKRVRTPCVGVCSTTFGDTVCRGCRRFLHEVVNWNAYGDEEKAIVWRRLDSFMRLVVGNYVEVLDPALLRQQLEYQNLRFQPELSPEGWVPDLLKAAGQRPLDWGAFGLAPRNDALTLTPRDLFELITAELHALSQAHYDRCHVRPVRNLAELLESEKSGDGAPGGT